jgi:hypothetical protein
MKSAPADAEPQLAEETAVLRRELGAKVFVAAHHYQVLFGATHLNPWQFVSGTALGLMFAWWYARTRSLIPSLAGHALANAAVVGHQSLGFKVQGFNAGDPLASGGFQPFWFDALGLLFLAAGLWLFRVSTPPIQAEAGPLAEPSPLLAPPILVPENPESPPSPPPDAPRSAGGPTARY